MTNEQFAKVLDTWTNRAEAMQIKPGTKKYLDRRLEFLLGASAADQAITGALPVPSLVLAAVGWKTQDLYPNPKETPK